MPPTPLQDLLHDPGWAHLLAAPESEVDDDVHALADPGLLARIVRGQRCTSRESLFQEFAAALQFPHYFGENWDAFEECLGDLSWFGGSGLLLVVTNADKLLVGQPENFRTLVTILRSVHDEGGSPLQRLFLHCTPEARQATRDRYRKAGLALS